MIGQRIAEARKTRKLSQAQLGANLGVTRAAVSQYEENKIRPRPRVVAALAQLFECSPEWFEHGRGRRPKPLAPPLVIQKIDIVHMSDRKSDVHEHANGRRWSLPAACLPGTSAHDDLVVIVAPNAAGPIQEGDSVVIDTKRTGGKDVALVVSAAGARLVTDAQRGDARLIGYAIGYLRMVSPYGPAPAT